MKKISMLILLIMPLSLLSCVSQPTLSAKDKMKHQNAEQVAHALKLEGHVEGGFYRRTYQADHRDFVTTPNGERFLMTSIYYMLTSKSPIGHFHLNKSDIMHYYHLGNSIRYTLIYPNGKLETVVMGSDVTKGEVLQLMVKGGIWKASELLNGEYDYGLISEAVTPGFDFADMTLGHKEKLIAQFPEHTILINKLTKD